MKVHRVREIQRVAAMSEIKKKVKISPLVGEHPEGESRRGGLSSVTESNKANGEWRYHLHRLRITK